MLMKGMLVAQFSGQPRPKHCLEMGNGCQLELHLALFQQPLEERIALLTSKFVLHPKDCGGIS